MFNDVKKCRDHGTDFSVMTFICENISADGS